MNATQIKAAQTATKKSWLEFKTHRLIDGELSFTMETIGDSFYIFGSNTGTTGLFDKHFMVSFLIGPRGGINNIKVH
jgi:hypothetical protein